MAQHRKLTPIVVSRIGPWVQQGLSANEIAQRIGCTVGTLRVRCSQLKISLRRGAVGGRGNVATGPGEQALAVREFLKARQVEEAAALSVSINRRLLVVMSPTTIRQLHHKAAVKGLSDSRLAATLLERIAQDDLYDAVLDE
jgi:hypothetical protein